MAVSLSPAAERLRGRLLADARRSRWQITAVEDLLVDGEPDLLVSPERRAVLSGVLAELAEAGVIDVPDTASWDRTRRPHLPRTLTVVRQSSPRARKADPPAVFPWRPELAWAATIRLQPRERTDLEAVNAFLRDDGAARPVVPARERSVELFGYEKRLDEIAASRLFGPGRLSWALLRAEPVHPPFVWHRTGVGDVVIVAENHHTFHSLTRTVDDPRIGAVIYGAGNHFCASVTYLADLPPAAGLPAVACVLYFGDLDLAGLTIAARAAAVAAAHGLPAIEPAGALYELLVAFPDQPGDPVAPAAAANAAAWLPVPLRDQVATTLGAGRRWAQERVGYELLSSDATWQARLLR